LNEPVPYSKLPPCVISRSFLAVLSTSNLGGKHMGKQETKDHIITTDKESLVPLDPGGIVEGIIGHETDRTRVYDKETKNRGWYG
jgi:hypothetical protein